MAGMTEVREGMTAYSADGKKLGKVIRRFSDTLVIEKGLFFKKDYVVGPEHVDRVEGDNITLRLTQDQLENADVADQQADREDDDEDTEAPGAGTRSSEGQPSDQARAAGDDEPDAVLIEVEEEVVVLAPDDDNDPNRRR